MRLIDADALKEEIEMLDAESNNQTYKIAMGDMLRFFIDLIDKQPTIKPEIQTEYEQLKRDLKAYRSFYPMKNEVCEKCVFADECMDANRVDGKAFCSSFHAKLEKG